MAKAPNQIKELYNKVRRRLLNQARKLEKQGFKGAREKIPSIPKKITEGSIRRLEKLSERGYRKLKEGLSTEQGKSVREFEWERRQKSSQKAKETRERNRRARESKSYEYYDDTLSSEDYARNIIDEYIEGDLASYNDDFASYIADFIEKLVDIYSPEEVANMINTLSDKGILPTRWQLYTVEGVYNYTSQMFSYMQSLSGSSDIDFWSSSKAKAVQAYNNSLARNYSQEFEATRDDYHNARSAARRAARETKKRK